MTAEEYDSMITMMEAFVDLKPAILPRRYRCQIRKKGLAR
jgi:hypothetical protein